MQGSIFGQLEFQNHISKFMVTYVDILDKRMLQPDGLMKMKGEHSLGQ